MVGDLGERRADFCVDLGNGVRVEMWQPLRRPRRDASIAALMPPCFGVVEQPGCCSILPL
jgi:hypothetical protein